MTSIKERYERQIPIIGKNGQYQLSHSKIVIVGMGGLGCPSFLYLLQSGIGHITIVDNDLIDKSNLHRQILFSENDVEKSKVLVAKKVAHKKNSYSKIIAINARLTQKNAERIFKDASLILDCTDNYYSRYLINAYSKKLSIPLISASIFKTEATVLTLNYKNSACLECVFPEEPPKNLIPNCSESGVLGIDVGIVGLYQAREALNTLLGKPCLNNKIMSINLDALSVSIKEVSKKSSCTSSHCSPFILSYKIKTISIEELQKLKCKHNDIQLIDVRSEIEHNESNIGGINIPLDSIERNITLFDKNKTIIFYCQTGRRSLIAAKLLLDQGFLNVISLIR